MSASGDVVYLSEPCCLLIHPHLEEQRKEGEEQEVRQRWVWQEDTQMTGLTRNIEKGHVWVPVMFNRHSLYLYPSVCLVCRTDQLWRACFPSSCLILPSGSVRTHTHRHTQRKGKRKSERDEEKSIIIKLPANTDKRSAIPLETHSFQYTNIHTL